MFPPFSKECYESFYSEYNTNIRILIQPRGYFFQQVQVKTFILHACQFCWQFKNSGVTSLLRSLFFGMSRMGERYVTSQTTAASLFLLNANREATDFWWKFSFVLADLKQNWIEFYLLAFNSCWLSRRTFRFSCSFYPKYHEWSYFWPARTVALVNLKFSRCTLKFCSVTCVGVKAAVNPFGSRGQNDKWGLAFQMHQR